MNISDLEKFRSLLTTREQKLTDLMGKLVAENESEAERVRALLVDIKEALDRVENHSYGVCKVCEDQIELLSLAANPTTEVCIECMSPKERAALESELAMAGRIHRALLPQKAPEIGGFEIAARSVSPGSVGGDYYDFLRPQDSDNLSVVIADSMGKGISAAMLMSNLQGAMRVLAETYASPAMLLTHLNKWLCHNIPMTSFTSLAFLRLGTCAGVESSLCFANAGHPPPVLFRADGKVEQCPATGLLLGVDHQADYQEQSLVLDPGDLLLLYTDGLTEAENSRGQMFGEQDLIDFVNARRTQSTESLVNDTLAEILRHTGQAEFDDDATIIALRKVG